MARPSMAWLTEELDNALERVFDRLPADVQEYVDDKVTFICLSEDLAGLTVRLPGWTIILSDTIAHEDVESVIAHEIAHAWLKHDSLCSDDQAKREADARRQAREWGFFGHGAHSDGEEGKHEHE